MGVKRTILNRGVFKRRFLLLSSVALATVLFAGEGALAKDVRCESGRPSCFGTNQADIMIGTRAANNMFGLAGADLVQGREGADYLRGDRGEDTVRGGRGADTTVWGGGYDDGGNFNDRGDDQVRGGGGDDTIVGGFARSGVDYAYGGKGDDTINAAQRNSDTGAAVTREVIDCGPGWDTVYYDEGTDEVKDCEVETYGTTSSGRMAVEFINDDGVLGNAVPLPRPGRTP